jgi:MFS family permease
VAPRRRTDPSTLSLVLLALASGFGQFGAVASLDEVARHFGHAASGTSFAGVVGLSGTTLGLGLAVLRLASLFALPLAALADRWGRKKVLRRVAIAGLALTALAAGSPSYWAFVAFFALARPLLSASITLVQVVTVELASPARRAHRLAWIAAGAGVGAGLSAVLHGLLPGANGFRLLFATAVLPALAVAPLLRRVPEPDARHREGDELVARLGVIPAAFRRRMVVVAALTVVVGVITGPANGFAFVYGEGVLKISRHEVALVVLLSAATGLAGLVAGRWLADRIGRRATVALGTVAIALTSTLAYSGGRASFVAGYMFGVFAAALLAPAAGALANEIFPHAIRATAAGWVVVAGVLGAIVGLAVFGLVGDVAHSAVTVDSLRVPALVTFLPTLPLLWLLRTLPETRGVAID